MACCDPVLANSEQGLASRKLLFYFSSIEEESGDYEHHFPGYDPYISSQPVMIEYLPTDYGRDAFLHMMQARARRVRMIVATLKDNGITVRASDDCWTAIGQWITATIEPNKEQSKNQALFRPLWYSLLLDLSILLGEQMISLKPGTCWYFWGDLPDGYSDIRTRSPLIARPESDKHPSGNMCFPMELVFAAATTAMTNKLNNNSSDKQWGKHLFRLALQGQERKH